LTSAETFLLGLLPPSSPLDNGFPCLCYSQAILPLSSLFLTRS
jgi:hypothetical protein